MRGVLQQLTVGWKLRGNRAIAYLLFVIPSLLFIRSLIVMQPHNWDLDAFLYLGSRLNNGKLLYISDFETKLPLIQYVFWLPFQLGE